MKNSLKYISSSFHICIDCTYTNEAKIIFNRLKNELNPDDQCLITIDHDHKNVHIFCDDCEHRNEIELFVVEILKDVNKIEGEMYYPKNWR